MKQLTLPFLKYRRALVGTCILLCAGLTGAQDVPVLKMRATSSYPQDNPVGKAMDLFAKRVAELSGGKMTVQVFHQGKLYTEDKSVQAVLDGTVDIGMASASNHGPFTKAWVPVEAPYLLDKKQFREIVLRGAVRKDIEAQSVKDGLKPLMILETGGHRLVGGIMPIRVPADLKQAKIRAAQSPVILAFYRALGANPVAVPWGETYLALASKTVDGVDANMASWPLGNLGEVAKHVTTIYWAPTSTVSDVSVKWWGARTDQQKAILEQAAKEAEDVAMKLEDQNDQELRAQLKRQGVTVYDPNPAEMAEWRKVGESIWAGLSGDQALIAKIKSMTQGAK